MARNTKHIRRRNIFACFGRRKQHTKDEVQTPPIVSDFPMTKLSEVLASTDNETSLSNASSPSFHISTTRRPRQPPRSVWNQQSIASEVTIDPLLMTVVAGHDQPGARASRLGHSGVTVISDASEQELRDADNDTVATGSCFFDGSLVSDVTGYDVVSI